MQPKKQTQNQVIPTSHKIIKRITWVLFPFLLTIMMEYLQRESFGKLLTWLGQSPYHVLMGFISIMLVFMIFYSLFGRTYLAMTFTGALAIMMALINYFKKELRGEPFVPWDIFIGKEAAGIMQYIKIDFTAKIVLSIIVVILCCVGAFFIKEKKYGLKVRLTTFVASVALFFISFQFIYLNDSILHPMDIYYVNWSQDRNYEYNGFLVGFCINIRNVLIEEPKTYTKEAVEAISSSIESEETAQKTDSKKIKPNIIMVMNESFWDPTKIEGAHFSTNPIPNVEKLRKEGMSGWILTEQYGGGTANSEFEVLTGHATMFLPQGSIAYQQYVKHEQPSLASFLKSEGYSTTAIHSYEKWFWNREDVYPLIGFDRFISDEDFVNPEKRGNYISDHETIRKVINTFEEQKAKSDAPVFEFTVTMENHSTYNKKYYPTRRISASQDKLSKQGNHLFDTYVQGVIDADAALGELIDYFSKVEEPTIVIMFGDHLPLLGDNYQVYKESGYVNDGTWSAEDYINMYTTPFVAWNNYDLKQEDLGIMNAHYLAPTLLSKMNVAIPKYFEYLLELKEEVPVCSRYVCLDEKGNPQLEPSQKMKEALQKHWVLQYDMMFGKDYGTDTLKQAAGE